MTDHLTRHSAEHDDDFAREGDVRETGGLAEHDGGADFREPVAEEHDGDHALSTADLASASNRPAHGTDDTGTATGTDTVDAADPVDTTNTVDTTDAADAGAAPQSARPSNDTGDDEQPLIDEEKITGFRDRWQNVQVGFVDDPQKAVREADELVAGVISALATTFAEHKSELEGQWRHGEPATEDLRLALRRYRSFFDQLLPR
ncbi:hypothetical protein VA596_28885 [Amycolatopsis sp., V23-08]|uniref:Uncharacterized protein n=1 Tax=Amycolatopsis heterodermiae TaxID=3110235 RepID=A0ABU5RD92_9PSEU|nr:hypothetical protein [Amycolatopsis sp., V23-08]MEA5363579.1 hypothetical protein [Amycolatopsis sp., V23-08]